MPNERNFISFLGKTRFFFLESNRKLAYIFSEAQFLDNEKLNFT